MNSQHLISVIIPCYKVEKYLPACIESVMKQTYGKIEIILVDDGSPDRCGMICDNYAQKDNRIIVIHKPNGGLSDARNAALDIAKGEYLTFVDSDDTVAVDYVEEQYRLIEKYDCQMSVTQWQTFVEGTQLKIRQDKPREICFNTPQEAVTSMYYQEEFDNAVCGKMYHRDLFKSLRFPKGLVFEDDYLVYQLMFKCKKVAYSNKITYYYLLRSDSIEGAQMSPNKIDSALAVLESLEKDHCDLVSQVIPAYRSRYLSFCMHLLLKAPDNYEKMNILWDKVKEFRMPVIFDRRARPKARIAGLLSYFGMGVLKQAFKFVDQRK